MSADANHQLSILVIEDDPAVRAVLYRVLTGAGHEVLCAAADDDARSLRRFGRRLDLLILDVNLDEPVGLGVAADVCSGRHALPVLFLSDSPPPAAALPGTGRRSFLRKPFKLEELTQAVARAGGAAV